MFIDEDGWITGNAPPFGCARCGHIVNGDGTVAAPCPSGMCNSLRCGMCGREWASVGPIDCWSCGIGRNPRVSALRQAYRRRTKGRRRA